MADIFFHDEHPVFENSQGHEIPRIAFFDNFESLSSDDLFAIIWRGFQLVLAFQSGHPLVNHDLFDAKEFLDFVKRNDSALDFGELLG
jgi:hypothetical protein